MNYFSTLKLKTILGIVLTFVLLFAAGCSHQKDKSKRDLFFETWKLRAQESKGHSPSPRNKDIKLVRPKSASKKTIKTKKRPLPSQKVTLKMDNENVGVILRTLARGVSQNIIINSNVKGKINIDIKNVPWNEAFLGVLHANGLTHTWEGSILRVMTLSDMERDLKASQIKEKQKSVSMDMEAVEPVLTQVIPIDYACAEQLKKNLLPLLTKDKNGKRRGNVSVNTHANALIVQSNQSDLRRIIDVIKELDRPTPQILIEADIVETTRDIARELGVQWGGRYNIKTNSSGSQRLYLTPGYSGDPKNTGGGPTFGVGNSGNGFGVNFPASMGSGSGASMGLMFGTMGGNILEMQLSALEAEGKINIISRPSITTLDNQTAVTTSGTEIPYITHDGDGDMDVDFKDAVLKLSITPHVIANNYLKMKIIVTKNEVDFSSDTRVMGNPVIKKRETYTTLIVQDSETIVISGLSKSIKSQSKTGVPGLKNLPGLGWMFRNSGNANNKEEVLIFITPHILKQRIAGNEIPGADIIEERNLPILDDASALDVPDK
ncbi:MAG: type IV pilus assembly protein PilQ [Candidatus Magnetoglobus multicellularis str. Araruama]|uniref:Type IV pilus assembly protein PilQ n=1 Tax=Candidatus Magnetoglobus multicellularis str. Araruama TaxID=890399 RepID=A0A1V1PI45_9BACT|nr:MAG: type IV pilus assembly protein PilQ [Candidatus Magnetoglobus multicellularis str. Araruama]